jgi:uncharacterized membrane protein YphA (DoxX/SURF4 family)
MSKTLDNFLKYFVGILFIFSGLVKVNDPIGTSIKLKEYFEVFATDFAPFFEIFIPYSLVFAVFVVVLEVVLGLALLLHYRMKLTAWLFLLLIAFFTFLTFYSAYFNKVTECGCFGDAIPLTAWQSFGKDVVLSVLVILIFIRQKHFKAFIPVRTNDIIIGIALIFNIYLAIHSIRHLPYVDFRAYKIGNYIPEQMMPSEPYRYKYIMEKDGEEFEFTEYPSDTTYKYKDMIILNPEAQPKITDYHIWTDDGEFTEETFIGNKLFIIFYDVTKASTKHLDQIVTLIREIESRVDVWALTASADTEFEIFRHEHQLAIPYFYADMTVLEAIIRSNPGLWLMQDGKVIGKWHHNDVPEAKTIIDLLEQ